MSLQNTSITVTYFVIGGFDAVVRPVAVGVVILIFYLVAVFVNTLNIFFIIFDKRLHKPMYLLVCNLGIVDIIYTSTVIPTVIGVLLAGANTISYVPCIIQMFVFHVGGVMERFALSFMAFDRLIATVCPFQYHSYITNARVVGITFILWLVGSAFMALAPATVVPLPHCSSRLRYVFCDYAAVIRTTCADPNYYLNISAIVLFFLLFFTFILICLSYCVILFFVKLSSKNEKKKMSGTLLSHLICVTCHYSPTFVLIVLTRLGVVLSLEERNGLLIWTILGSPVVNPFVYCLRTKEIKNRIFEKFRKVDI